GWYLADATLRPAPDSLGRIQALRDLEDRDVLGQAAQKTGHPFSFEDRADLRNHRSQTLSNALFMHEVKSVPSISDDSLKKVTTYYSRELKLRLLYFASREQAEGTRMQLVGGRLTWAAAAAKYGVRSTTV